MKVLFAVSNEAISEAIIERYQKIYKESLVYKDVYYFNAVIKELEKNEYYDAIVMDEALESIRGDRGDSILLNSLESIVEYAYNVNPNMSIILILKQQREKGEEFLNKLYNLGIYNALIGQDRKISTVCEVMANPRSEKEAIEKYGIVRKEVNKKIEQAIVPIDEIRSIKRYYRNLFGEEAKYSETFDKIARQYSDYELAYIISKLPIQVTDILAKENNKYKDISKNSKKLLEEGKAKEAENLSNVLSDSDVFIPRIKKDNKKADSKVNNNKENNKDNNKDNNKENNKSDKKDKEAKEDKEENKQRKENSKEEKDSKKTVKAEAEIDKNKDKNNQAKDENEKQTEEKKQDKNSNENDSNKQNENKNKDDKNNKKIRDNKKQDVKNEDEETNANNSKINTSAIPTMDFEDIDFDDDFEDDKKKSSKDILDNSNEKADEKTEDNNTKNNDKKEDKPDALGDLLDQTMLTDDIDFGDDEEDFFGNSSKKANTSSDEINNIKTNNEVKNKSENNNMQKEPKDSAKENKNPDIKIEPTFDVNDVDFEDDKMREEDNTKPANNSNNKEVNNNQANNAGNLNPNSNNKPNANPNQNSNFKKNMNVNNNQNNITNIKQGFKAAGINNNNVQRINSAPVNPKASRQNYISNANMSEFNNSKSSIFVGTSKNGISFMVNSLAMFFSSIGINVAVLDLTQNKNSYYMSTNNDERLRQIATDSIHKLKQGIANGIEVSRNLTVYTGLPTDQTKHVEFKEILSTLYKNHTLILIDADYTTPMEYFRVVNDIFVVQSLDILTIQPATQFMRDLKRAGMLPEGKLKIIVNKETSIRGLTKKSIVGALSTYNSPSMTSIEKLFGRNKVKVFSVKFDMHTYQRYMENVVYCKYEISGYSKNMIEDLKIIAGDIYPLNNRF